MTYFNHIYFHQENILILLPYYHDHVVGWHKGVTMKKLYTCGFGMCPEVVLFECGFGACPRVSGGAGVVVIEHPTQPEKGRVEMTPAEWNALLKDGKPVQGEA